MKLQQGSIEVQLVEGQKLAFRDACDVQLECTEGRIWLTLEGQADDFLLAKGERLRIADNGLALIQGLPNGSVHLVSLAARPNPSGGRFVWLAQHFAAHMVA